MKDRFGSETMNSEYGMTTKEVQVYEQIKNDILKNEFEPGTVLVERSLTERYNVSRSPVRYALRQLVKDGLLSGEPGKGIIVPVYTLEDILEVYDLLEVLQVYALQVSIKNYNIIADAQLDQMLEQTKKLTEEGKLEERMEWDIKFHSYIVSRGNNKRLDMMFELLVNQKRRFDVTSFSDQEHHEMTTKQHIKILEAIKRRDLEGSIAAMREHEQYIKQYYINKLIIGRYNI